MTSGLRRRRALERWIALVRLAAVPFTGLEVWVLSGEYPPGYLAAASATAVVLAAGALVLWWLARRPLEPRPLAVLGVAALAFDALVVSAFTVVYQFEVGTPVRQLFWVVAIEAAVRYGLRGALAFPVVAAAPLSLAEWWRSDRFPPPEGFVADHVALPVGLLTMTGLIVGRLVDRLAAQGRVAEERLEQAERLRDELGRRFDVLDAANRCARALASSLDPAQAFEAFARELRGVLPFDRMTVLRTDGDELRVAACAGLGSDTLPVGAALPVPGSIAEDLRRGAGVVYRPTMADGTYAEEVELLGLGLRSRVVVPLQSGAQVTGLFSLSRCDPDGFEPGEIELAGLLGRLITSAVQNLRTFEAERQTVEELRRLSALRADFVSLVSHELRGPLASVTGAARTIQTRWDELTHERRNAFLELITAEARRLSTLVTDVLDTTRIDSGSFGYTFGKLDLGALVRDTVAVAAFRGRDVRIACDVPDGLPLVRGDRDRLRQVLTNLVDNALVYAPDGDEVRVAVRGDDGAVSVDVTDNGPGIAPEDHELIFEKFGRAPATASTKPGTGLGLYIARSIAEAHGGTLGVRSTPGSGATFTLALPVPAADG